MILHLALAASLATSPPLLQKAAPQANPSVTAAPLLNKAAPAPRSSEGRQAVHTFTNAGSRGSTVVVNTYPGGRSGAGWGAFGLFGVIGLIGLWRRWTAG
jgi:hypothetical protein